MHRAYFPQGMQCKRGTAVRLTGMQMLHRKCKLEDRIEKHDVSK